MSASHSVVVTGASSGIGAAIVARLAAKGWTVFPMVRSEADAARLAGPRVHPLLADVRAPETLADAAALVAERLEGRRLTGFVANAGVARPGPLIAQPLGAFRDQLEVNLIGVLASVQAFADLLGVDPARAGPPGRIVTMSSVAGSMALPFLGGYAASKFGLEGLSHSLRRELSAYGIAVSIVSPGPVDTGIWAKGEALVADDIEVRPDALAGAMARFEAETARSRAAALPATRVAAVVEHALVTPRPRARYAVVRNRLVDWWLPRRLPERLIDRIIARRLGLRAPRR